MRVVDTGSKKIKTCEFVKQNYEPEKKYEFLFGIFFFQ